MNSVQLQGKLHQVDIKYCEAICLYDMSGCVAEFTSTPFMKVVPSDPLMCDPSLSDKKSVRGGSWWELFCSSGVAERDFSHFSMRVGDRGLRLCRFAT